MAGWNPCPITSDRSQSTILLFSMLAIACSSKCSQIIGVCARSKQHYQRLLSGEPLGLGVIKINCNNNLGSIWLLIFPSVSDGKHFEGRERAPLSLHWSFFRSIYDVIHKWLSFQKHGLVGKAAAVRAGWDAVSFRHSDVARVCPQSESEEPIWHSSQWPKIDP